jgi:hypothetical protein
MATFRRLKVKELIALATKTPGIVPGQATELLVSFGIIRSFLGIEYLERHFGPDAPNDGFFKLTPENASNIEAARNYRIVDLAELLFNLQRIPGFARCVLTMKDAKNPEPSYAELHIARMLYINGWQFRFVEPTGEKGEDYDFAINYYNNRVCADAKCKIEATDLSANTVRKTLSGSREQLPKDRPGVFFVKVPPWWIETREAQETTIQGVEAFFAQGSGRVVSVSLYCEPLWFNNGVLQQRHAYYELANPRRRFGENLDWRFFNKWRPPPHSQNALPFKWIRLANFPAGMKGHEQE